MTYFSILSAIASGSTTYGEIANVVGTDVGTYLANLEKNYSLVVRSVPLELYFRRKFAEESRCTRIGRWWDRKGENEIDLVVDDEFGEKIEFVAVKRDASRISLPDLRRKSEAFFAKNPNLRSRQASFAGLSIADM